MEHIQSGLLRLYKFAGGPNQKLIRDSIGLYNYGNSPLDWSLQLR